MFSQIAKNSPRQRHAHSQTDRAIVAVLTPRNASINSTPISMRLFYDSQMFDL